MPKMRKGVSLRKHHLVLEVALEKDTTALILSDRKYLPKEERARSHCLNQL